MVQTGQIIYFSNQEMMCFDVESIEDITEPPEQIETTSVYGGTRTYVPAMMNPTTLIVTGKELVKLDPTTMKRIARYNLEEENKSLLEEIAERKKVIDDLEQKEQVLRDRFKKAISTFKEIMEHGYSEDDDEDEYESEWE
jgi:seryl-tRNA synthetase